ncbi:hypothetical protein MMC22_007897 [Lobaria immixta]|nr:hypothetical protein [Lobaria immixta]
MTAKELDKNKLLQTTFSRLEKDLEVSQGREERLPEDGQRLQGLVLEAERLKTSLEQADHKVEAFSPYGLFSRASNHVLHAEKTNLAAEPSAATARLNRALVKADCCTMQSGHQPTELERFWWRLAECKGSTKTDAGKICELEKSTNGPFEA